MALLGVLAAGDVLAHAAGSSTEVRFTTPGTHTWTAPDTGTVTFDAFGAQGGGDLGPGGKGGEARASFRVSAGQTFEIVVGGPGGREGGFNGGGRGNRHAGGGGGSDVRLGACASSKNCGLEDRILVGGGGGGNPDIGEQARGGDGGGRTGEDGRGSSRDEGKGRGGTQTGGEGSFGRGSDAILHFCHTDNGGGGGGWFGGGAGTPRCDAAAGGGGGSGFIDPLAVSGSFPGGHEAGDGKVIVTFS